MKRTLSSLILSALALPAAAQQDDAQPERWYEVEIIIFENLKKDEKDNEYWPPEVGQPVTDTAIELLPRTINADAGGNSINSPPAAAPEAIDLNEAPADLVTGGEADSQAPAIPLPTPYQLLNADEYQLVDAYNKLDRSEDYQPLVHVAWRQVVPPRNTPDVIHIHSDLPLPFEEATEEQAKETPAEEPTSIFSDNLQLELPVELMFEEDFLPKKLDGTVSIGLARYLHVSTDLVLYKPITEAEQEPLFKLPQPPSAEFMPFAVDALGLANLELEEKEPPAELFQIQGTMRMRSGEVHYLDHPYGGMLILFTRYELPEPETEDTL